MIARYNHVRSGAVLTTLALTTALAVSGCSSAAEPEATPPAEQDASTTEEQAAAPEASAPEGSSPEQGSGADDAAIEEATDGLVGFDLGDLAEDFPADVVPLLDGEIVMSTDLTLGDTTKTWKVTIVPEVAADEIATTVQSRLADAGFGGEWSNMGENISLYTSGDAQDDLFQVTVQLTTDDGRTAVAYGVTRKLGG